jgi:ABC-type phosphonate transport system ATPase subunit
VDIGNDLNEAYLHGANESLEVFREWILTHYEPAITDLIERTVSAHGNVNGWDDVESGGAKHVIKIGEFAPTWLNEISIKIGLKNKHTIYGVYAQWEDVCCIIESGRGFEIIGNIFEKRWSDERYRRSNQCHKDKHRVVYKSNPKKGKE